MLGLNVMYLHKSLLNEVRIHISSLSPVHPDLLECLLAEHCAEEVSALPQEKKKKTQEGKRRRNKQGAVLHTDTGTCLLASSLILLTLGPSYLSRPMPPLTPLPLW